MVMKRNAMRKNLQQSILKSFGRYIAIVMIIALGSSMFVGLLMTKTDMVATGQAYMDQQNMFDLRLVSNYGWDPEHVDAVAQMEGVEAAEGLIYLDLMAHLGSETEEESVFRFYSIPEKLNQLVLRGGRMPENSDECLADGFRATDDILGTTVTISQSNDEDSLDSIQHRTYTIVGYVSTPLYMDMNRGTTSVGNGSLNSYFYIPEENFNIDYYTEINLTIPGDYEIYSDEYNAALEAAADRLEPLVQPLAQGRMEQFRSEALEEYNDALAEYEDGYNQYQEEKQKAEQELADAEQQLIDGEEKLNQSERQLISGQQQIAEAKVSLEEGEKQLQEGWTEFQTQKTDAYAQLDTAKQALDSSLALAVSEQQALAAELADINSKIAAIDAVNGPIQEQINTLDSQIAQLDAEIAGLYVTIQSTKAALEVARLFPALNAELIAQLEGTLSSSQSQYDTNTARRSELDAQRSSLQGQFSSSEERTQLEMQRVAVQAEKSVVDTSVSTIQAGVNEMNNAYALLDEQFASAEAELNAAEAEIAAGKQQIQEQEAAISSGWAAIESGRQEIADGWIELEEGKETAQKEFAEAEEELAEAKDLLDEAKEIIDSMVDAKVYILDRTSNIGYNSLDSSSDIVQGVSRVFPAFFLLVAALVCITTMTRMIDEERTQIGTLKALGYSNEAIINKYLFYAGSGAIVGCGLGVLVGSVVFPTILWEAYKIMLYITDEIVLKFNWWLCAIVVGAYTAVMLLVTWYCCRRTLKEVPAELIRPKAPDPGKKILMEYLPFWHKISFLNKVTIRNIFRYRQRLAMMMVGIGGCTALLVTGFGLRDSVVNVVDYQFEEVTTYDMSVYFTDGQTEEEQADFLKDIAGRAENAMFYHQSSVELDHGNQSKEIYLIAADSGVQDFMDFHSDEKPISLPGTDEVLLSSGVAEALGIGEGDVITLRNADMQTLELTVSGVYDNHVYNYAFVTPATIEKQWLSEPEMQMAFVTVKEGQDAHKLSADISGMSDVMNVSVSEDLAGMVGGMMEALDLVVWVIVFCAGLLAAIVLYNLTNININERIREIATIKVLGFNAKETALYVFKENLSLTVAGGVVGLGLGYLLLLFVMSQIKIDMVWFKALVMPMSYVWAIVLTMLAALIVDFVFYFKLDRINMAEALKSVE